jgi:hypothetical protein
MAQIPIREYDAKRLREKWSGTQYTGVLVETAEEKNTVVETLKC